MGNKDIKELCIPEGVTIINDREFADYLNLRKVRLPDSLKILDEEAFNCCPSLSQINLPQGLEKIGSMCFHDCLSLKTLDIPDSVKEIGDRVFMNSGLTEIRFPHGIDAIETSTFLDCTHLEKVHIPQTVLYIEDSAFMNCNRLKTARLPDGLAELGAYAFWKCKSLTQINIPQGVTVIKERTFRECSSLASLYLHDNIRRLGRQAFMGCKSIKYLRVPKDLSISADVFVDCSGIEHLIVGDYDFDVKQAVQRAEFKVGELVAAISEMVRTKTLSSADYCIDSLSAQVLYDIVFQLYGFGFKCAEEFIRANVDTAFMMSAEIGNAQIFDMLSDKAKTLSEQQTDEYIELAIKNEYHSLYLSLLKYKRDVLGFPDISDRLKL